MFCFSRALFVLTESAKNHVLNIMNWTVIQLTYLLEPRHDKTCFCHMRTIKAQIKPVNWFCHEAVPLNTKIPILYYHKFSSCAYLIS